MAFLTRYAFGAEWHLATTAAVLMGACCAVLAVGRFRGLCHHDQDLARDAGGLDRGGRPRLGASGRPLDGSPCGRATSSAPSSPSPSSSPSSDGCRRPSMWPCGAACDARQGQVDADDVGADAKRDFLVGFAGTGILALVFVFVGSHGPLPGGCHAQRRGGRVLHATRRHVQHDAGLVVPSHRARGGDGDDLSRVSSRSPTASRARSNARWRICGATSRRGGDARGAGLLVEHGHAPGHRFFIILASGQPHRDGGLCDDGGVPDRADPRYFNLCASRRRPYR